MSIPVKQDVIIAPGVAESIVAHAVAQVEGVAQIGSKPQGSGGLLAHSLLGILANNKPAPPGVLIFEEQNQIIVDIHLKLYYGYKLEEVAANTRAAVVDALLTQACITIDRVDITIDRIAFKA